MKWFLDAASWIVALAVATAPFWLWILTRSIERRINAGVDSRFAERIETHKHELGLIAEAARFDHQRKLHDFELFVSKKHEVYAGLWELVRRAEGAVLGLVGFRREPDYEKLNRQDIEEYMNDLDFPSGKMSEILEQWDSNRKKAVTDLRAYLRLREIDLGRRARQDVVNYLLANELYFSDGVVRLTEEYVDELYERISRVEYPELARGRPEKHTNEDIRAGLRQLKELMRRELSVGYYSAEQAGAANGG